MTFKIDRSVLHNLVITQIHKVLSLNPINLEQRLVEFMFLDDLDDICNRIIKEIKSDLDIDLTIPGRSIDDNTLTLIQKVFDEIHE